MINQILSLFTKRTVKYESENFSHYQLKFECSNCDYSGSWNYKLYEIIKEYFGQLNYDWEVGIDDIGFVVNQNHFDELSLENLLTDKFEVNINVFKNSNSKTIFNQNVFENDLDSKNLESLLNIFSTLEEPVIIQNHGTVSCSSNFLGYNQSPIDKLEIKLSTQCLYHNYSAFKFTPENFKLSCVGHDKFIDIVNKLYFVHLLIYIFDISEINEDELYLKIEGNKTFEYKLKFNQLDITGLEEYKKVYEWVYSEEHKIEDKIGIARNIISFYIDSNSITLDKRVFPSVLSANKLYIKENLVKYLDVRNKIFEQVDQIANKINSSLETFFNNFQKSVFIFISFYLSIFIVKIFDKNDVKSILSKEATLTGLGLLLLYLVFMLFSLINLNADKIRVIEKYSLLKKRFQDILDSSDVDLILQNNLEFNNELLFFRKRRKVYIVLWISTLVILLTVLFSTSEYVLN